MYVLYHKLKLMFWRKYKRLRNVLKIPFPVGITKIKEP